MKKVITFLVVVSILMLSACTIQCECNCNCNGTNNSNGAALVAVETTTRQPSKYEGTWVCELWYDAQGDANRNAKLVIEPNGVAQYRQAEDWATFSAQWKEIDENTISISYTTIYNTISESEYTYVEENGVCHLVFDNGKVSRVFIKQ